MKTNGSILVVEPNGGLLTTLDILLKKHFSHVESVSAPDRMYSVLQAGGVDVAVVDLGVCTDTADPGSEIKELGRQYPNLQIVLIATFAQTQLAVSLAGSCALDYFTKPWNNDKVAISVRNALTVGKLKREAAQLKREAAQLKQELEDARKSATEAGRGQSSGSGFSGGALSGGVAPEERVSILSVLEDETLEQMELRIIKAVLSRNRGNISLTAQQLGITRQTLYNKGKKYGLID